MTDVGVVASGATYAGVIVPVCIALVYIIQKFYLRTSRQVRLLDIESKAPLYEKLNDVRKSMPHIRAFGWQSHFVAQCIALVNYSQKPYYIMFCIQRWLTIVLDLSVGGIAVILITCAVKFRNTTSQTAIGLALVNLTTFSQSLSKMITWWISMETAFGAVSRTKSFITTTLVEESAPDDPDDQELQSWPRHGTIELDDVSSSYLYVSDINIYLVGIALLLTRRHSTPTNAFQVGIDEITTAFPAGQTVSVMGRTGRYVSDVNNYACFHYSALLKLTHQWQIFFDNDAAQYRRLFWCDFNRRP